MILKLGERFLCFFDMSLQKNVKSHVFLDFEKKTKKRILELWVTGCRIRRCIFCSTCVRCLSCFKTCAPRILYIVTLDYKTRFTILAHEHYYSVIYKTVLEYV